MDDTDQRRFFRYDPSELRAVGEAVTGDLGRLAIPLGAASDPSLWTELLLDWLSASAAERARVDAEPGRAHLTRALYEELTWPSPRRATRPGLLALMHVSHPSFEREGHPYGYAYWERALESERLEVLLAAQLEWGQGARPAGRYGRVMLAAADLASVDSRAKAMFFATDAEEERRRVVQGLSKLRLASWDARPWLWVDVPWRADWHEHPPAFGVLEG